jgi:hypothetical protein
MDSAKSDKKNDLSTLLFFGVCVVAIAVPLLYAAGFFHKKTEEETTTPAPPAPPANGGGGGGPGVGPQLRALASRIGRAFNASRDGTPIDDDARGPGFPSIPGDGGSGDGPQVLPIDEGGNSLCGGQLPVTISNGNPNGNPTLMGPPQAPSGGFGEVGTPVIGPGGKRHAVLLPQSYYTGVSQRPADGDNAPKLGQMMTEAKTKKFMQTSLLSQMAPFQDFRNDRVGADFLPWRSSLTGWDDPKMIVLKRRGQSYGVPQLKSEAFFYQLETEGGAETMPVYSPKMHNDLLTRKTMEIAQLRGQ